MTTTGNPPLFLEAWVSFLTAHAQVVPVVSEELEAACGIPLAWFDVLHQISLAPGGRQRMRELADAVLLSKSGLTRLVDRIEQAGLIARAAVPRDRRSMHVHLTPAGHQMVVKARSVVQQSVANHFGRFLSDAEQLMLREAFTRITRASRDSRAAQAE